METNKNIALRALLGTFVERDPSIVGKYFSADHIQHNPTIPNGSAAIPELIARLPPDFSYELGMVVAQQDLVMIHGRYKCSEGKTIVAVDIFRVSNGRVAEHWDVRQAEVPVEENGKWQSDVYTPKLAVPPLPVGALFPYSVPYEPHAGSGSRIPSPADIRCLACGNQPYRERTGPVQVPLSVQPHGLGLQGGGADTHLQVRANTRRLFWWGTDEGLYRFDGMQFEPIRSLDGVAIPRRVMPGVMAAPSGFWLDFGAETIAIKTVACGNGVTREAGRKPSAMSSWKPMA